ncbi:hypothetical protein E2C01_075706 [Portunus trituberculatus]|uniref:Uncharacterized protein n=1 Tax=Portunus trituberculatus TaxID=210409 RepID=A0A5B7IFR1_PORTR|nr:hypothetical protein [Portunus trituberculatus]
MWFWRLPQRRPNDCFPGEARRRFPLLAHAFQRGGAKGGSSGGKDRPCTCVALRGPPGDNGRLLEHIECGHEATSPHLTQATPRDPKVGTGRGNVE